MAKRWREVLRAHSITKETVGPEGADGNRQPLAWCDITVLQDGELNNYVLLVEWKLWRTLKPAGAASPGQYQFVELGESTRHYREVDAVEAGIGARALLRDPAAVIQRINAAVEAGLVKWQEGVPWD